MNLRGFQRARQGLISGACGVALAFLFAIPAPSHAQSKPAPPPAAINPFAPGPVIDFREHMRNFIQSISTYARSINPRFIVIAKDGMSLVGKIDPEDDTQSFPARAYMRAIDGVMETDLLDENTKTPDGKPDLVLEAIVKRRAADLAIARTTGLNIFALEYATEAKAIDALYATLTQKGTIPFVAESAELAAIPRHPSSAYKANAKPIASVADIQNYLYIAHAQSFGATNDFLQALRATNQDILIINVFQGRKPLTREDIRFLKYKKLGAPRMVLAEIDISSAASFDYFWKPGWGTGNPPFLFRPVREDPDRFRAIYWDADWQAIFTGNTNSFIYGAIDLGFDGVVLKGLDVWRYYETGGEDS